MEPLTTDRLHLRHFSLQDLDDFYEYASMDGVGIHAGWPKHENIETSGAVLNTFINNDEVFAIVHRSTGKVIGSAGLHRQSDRALSCKSLGFVVHPHFKNQGIAAEAAQLMLRYAFTTLDLQMVTADHFPGNQASGRVLKKCGFHYEGCLRNKYRLFNGLVLDSHMYSITRAEWQHHK